MNRILSENEILKINSLSFRIIRIYGIGSSCVVYEAINETDGTTHLIKEFNPRKFDLYRTNTGSLELESEDEEIRDSYNDYLKAFISGAQNQIDLRREDDITNSIANVHQLSEANGVAYVFMAKNSGNTLNLNEGSLYDTLQSVKALSLCISKYHKKGLLHLDIKPENIFVYPESKETVLLFDFDSMRTKAEAINGRNLSYTKSWAAPEQLVSGGYRQISEATDLYSIGELVFYKVFGRHSEFDEHRHTYEYSFDKDSAIFNDINPEVFSSLTELFRKTLCVNPKDRYQSAEELINHLDKLCKITEPHSCFIQSSPVDPEPYFVGRESEIEELDKLLDENRIVNVCGIGGIGKSEIVRNYIVSHIDKYDSVVYTYYEYNWIECITNDTNVSIKGFNKNDEETNAEYFKRKIRKLKDLCSVNTLFVIDNINDSSIDELYQENMLMVLRQLPCKFIFISRTHALNYRKIEVRPISNKKVLLEMFCKWYNADPSALDKNDFQYINKIISLVDAHTLTIELIAKQTFEGFSTPEEKYIQLLNNGLSADITEISFDKDSSYGTGKAIEHISRIFNITNLSKEEKDILLAMSMVPREGIKIQLFSDVLSIQKNNSLLLKLVRSAWIDRVDNSIRLHPIVSEVVSTNYNNLHIVSMMINYLWKNSICTYRHIPYDRRTSTDSLSSSLAEWIYKNHIPATTYAYFLLDDYWLETHTIEENRYLEYLKNLIESTHEQKSKYLIQESYNLSKAPQSITALAYLKIAEIYYGNEQYEQGFPYVKEAKPYANTASQIAAVCSYYGQYYYNKTIPNNKLAKEWFNKTLACFAHYKGNILDFIYTNRKRIEEILDFFIYYGDPKQAQSILEAMKIDINKVQCLDDSIEKADFLEMIGKTNLETGNYDEAIFSYEACLELRIRFLGKDDLEVGRTQYALVDCLLKRNESSENPENIYKAKLYLQNAQIIFEKLYPNGSQRLANLYAVFGGLYDNMNSPAEALLWYVKSYEMMEQLNLYNTPYLNSLINVAFSYQENKQPETAGKLFDKAIVIYEGIDGCDEGYYGKILINKAFIEYQKGNTASAIELLNKSKEILSKKPKLNTRQIKEIDRYIIKYRQEIKSTRGDKNPRT